MNEKVKIVLPKLGESIHSATIVQWFKTIGDAIQLDEPLLEVSTDKVNSEIPSPVAGILQEIHAKVDQELQVGDLLAVIGTGASVHVPVVPAVATTASVAAPGIRGEMEDFFSPALLRLAREKGVGLDQLQQIVGTGADGRITKKDVELYIEKKHTSVKPCPLQGTEGVEHVKMSGMRKAIADNMVRSFYEAPHATLVTEVDVTEILKLIQKDKEAFLAKQGFKLTITSFVARAIAQTLRAFPLINSSLKGDTILLKRFVNLGIAVSVEQGLLVPVIKHCERLSLVEIAHAISEISVKARSNKLSLEDVSDGTISMTNFGMSGVQIGVPIIRYPEVAIVGIGAIHRKVIPLEDDTLAIRSTMYVSLTFDHRVLDGMYGCSFLGALQKQIEQDLTIS